MQKELKFFLKAHTKVWRQFLTIFFHPLQIMKNVFYLTLKALFILKIFKLLFGLFGHV